MNYEINGNLKEEKNFSSFFEWVSNTLNFFTKTFGKRVMNKIEVCIDNATDNSGYTPVTTLALKKYIFIKLGIHDFGKKEQIVYQFSHELCHAVFYALYGIKPRQISSFEETICSAMSLIVLKEFFPDHLEYWISYVRNLENPDYQNGVVLASYLQFDIFRLKEEMKKLKL